MNAEKDEETDEVPNYKTKPTAEDIDRVFGDAIDATLNHNKWPYQRPSVADIEDAGFGRDEVVEAMRVATGGEWGHVHGDGNVAEVLDNVSVATVSAQENFHAALLENTETFADMEDGLINSFGNLVQAIHNKKSRDLLGDDSPHNHTDVCVILQVEN